MNKGWWGFWGFVLGSFLADQDVENAYEQGLRDARYREWTYSETTAESEMSTEGLIMSLFMLLNTASTVLSFYWGYKKLPEQWGIIGKISLVIALNLFVWITLGGALVYIVKLIKKQNQDLSFFLFGLIGIGFTGTCLFSFTTYLSALPQDWWVFAKVTTILGVNFFGWFILSGAVICLMSVLRKKVLALEHLIFGLWGIGFIITTILSFEKLTFNFPEHWWRIARIPSVILVNFFSWKIISAVCSNALFRKKSEKIHWEGFFLGLIGLGFIGAVIFCFKRFIPSSVSTWNAILRAGGIIATNCLWWGILVAIISSLLDRKRE